LAPAVRVPLRRGLPHLNPARHADPSAHRLDLFWYHSAYVLVQNELLAAAARQFVNRLKPAEAQERTARLLRASTR